MDFYDLTDSTELGVYLLIWLDMYKERLARNTYRGYLVNFRKHVIPYLGSVKLRNLKPMMVQQLYTRLLKEGLSGTSCVYVHNTFRKALNSAVRLEILSRNPVQLVEPPRKSRIRITPLSVSQAQILVDYCLDFDNPPVSMAVLLALLLGLRRGEVLGLQWRDIIPDEHTVEIRRTVTPDKAAPDGFAVSDVKTANSNRTLLLADALLELLLRYRGTAQPNPDGFLFWHMSTDYLTKHYKAILRDCGLPDIRFHDGSAKIGLNQEKPLQQGGAGLVLFFIEYKRKNKSTKKSKEEQQMGAKVIAVCCQKGGVGKTFTTASLGFGLVRAGKRVIGVDIDPQGSLARSLGFDPDKLKDTLASYLFQVMEGQEYDSKSGILRHEEGMDILPANIKLASTELMMAGQMNRELILKQYVETLRNSYDYILLDCPGSLGLLTINALAAADSVLIPTQAEQLAVEGLQAVLGAVGNVKRGINKDLIVQGILPTMVKERTNHMKAVIAGLHEAYGKQIHIYGTIPASIRAPESSAVGASIYTYDPKGKLAEMYGKLAMEVAGA